MTPPVLTCPTKLLLLHPLRAEPFIPCCVVHGAKLRRMFALDEEDVLWRGDCILAAHITAAAAAAALLYVQESTAAQQHYVRFTVRTAVPSALFSTTSSTAVIRENENLVDTAACSRYWTAAARNLCSLALLRVFPFAPPSSLPGGLA